MPLFRSLTTRFLLVSFFLFGSASAAENISLRTQALPALPAGLGTPIVATLGERVFAFGDENVRVWSPESVDWELVDGVSDRLVSGPVVWEGDFVAPVASSNADTKMQLVLLRVSGLTATSEPLVEFPESLSNPVLGLAGSRLYLGGQRADGSPGLYSRDLPIAEGTWTAESFAGESPIGAIDGLAVQDRSVFAFLNTDAGEVLVFRKSEQDEWSVREPMAATIVHGSPRPVGQAHVVMLGTAPNAPDGGLSMYSYHVMTNVWTTIGDTGLHGGAQAAGWGDGVATLSIAGEKPEVHLTEITMEKQLLQPLDWIMIVCYLGAMAGIGVYCYVREKRATTADFFVGGRKIPFWAAGLSLYATGTSAISYIAIPAKSFATDWLYLASNVVGLVATVFVAIWIVPLIRGLNLMSVYQYLELRFHPVIRMLASAICIVLQLGGRMSIVLFLPSLAISAVTGMDVVWCIVIMGGITIIYTVMGGMKAVIWTDVIQVFVMLGGAFFAIGYVLFKLDGGMGEFFATSIADGKMRTFDWSWDLTKATVWGFVFFAVLDVVTYPKDQVMMQRVLSTRSAKEAGWSVWTLAAVVVPGSLTFYAIGTALYVFYKSHPEKMNPLLNVDATFPHFIAAELPVGVTGLIIAGIFAASMSTLSSCINSVATLVSVDFYEKLAKNPDPKVSVRIAEALTFVAGVLGVGTAIALTFFDIRSFFDLSLELAGLLGGGFAGTYALGIFTKRANWQGAAIGVTVSIGVTLVAWSMRLVHSFFYSAIAIFTCIVVGYAASLLFPPPERPLQGLTIGRGGKEGRIET